MTLDSRTEYALRNHIKQRGLKEVIIEVTKIWEKTLSKEALKNGRNK